MKRYRAYIVGLGRIGMGYDVGLDATRYVLSHARALATHPAFELVGGFDPDAERRGAFAREYGRPVDDDLASGLGRHGPELVVLAAPTMVHAALLSEVLARSRPIAVLCEKPLAYDAAEARQMEAECQARGVRLFVNYIRRSEPGAVEVGRRLQSGAIQTPVKGTAWYTKGFLHNGSHFVDLLLQWLGPVRDAALLDPGRQCGAHDREPDVRIRFDRGSVLFLAGRHEDYEHCEVDLLAPNGRLRYEGAGATITWTPRDDKARLLRTAGEAVPTDMDRYQWHVAGQLAIAMDAGAAHLCTGIEGVQLLETMTTMVGPGGAR